MLTLSIRSVFALEEKFRIPWSFVVVAYSEIGMFVSFPANPFDGGYSENLSATYWSIFEFKFSHNSIPGYATKVVLCVLFGE
jgi:hypothetical protein